MKTQLIAIFKQYDIEAFIDEWNDDSYQIYIAPQGYSSLSNFATLILDDIELGDKAYSIYWKTRGVISYRDITNLINDIAELNKEINKPKLDEVKALLWGIEDELELKLEVVSIKPLGKTHIIEVKVESKGNAHQTINSWEIESFNEGGYYFDLINNIDLSRKFGAMIVERLVKIMPKIMLNFIKNL